MSRLESTVYWMPAHVIKPDADLAVLLDYDGETWPGTFDGEMWRDLDGNMIVADVLHWAEFPLSPPVRSPRFQNVSCSNCGRDFGPGDSGFSHCENHAHLRGVPA